MARGRECKPALRHGSTATCSACRRAARDEPRLSLLWDKMGRPTAEIPGRSFSPYLGNNVNLQTVQNTYCAHIDMIHVVSKHTHTFSARAGEAFLGPHEAGHPFCYRRRRVVAPPPLHPSAAFICSRECWPSTIRMRILSTSVSCAWSANCSLAASRTPAAVVSSRPLMARSTSR